MGNGIGLSAGRCVDRAGFRLGTLASVWLLVASAVNFYKRSRHLRGQSDAHPQRVACGMEQPVRLALFPSVCDLTASARDADAGPSKPKLRRSMWLVGVVVQGRADDCCHLQGVDWAPACLPDQRICQPAWFIPAVGNVIVAIAGVFIGLPR